MPLSNYLELRASILAWLARPGDPLVEPAVPDFIRLFEAEANRRLKHLSAERRVSLTATAQAALPLPTDFTQMRMAAIGGFPLAYLPPAQLPGSGGNPTAYTIVGREMLLGPEPTGDTVVTLTYQSGVPALSDTATTNWLLSEAPDLYLFGSLCLAEPYIGHDERVQLWVQAREAAFAALEAADRKARWPGGLQIRPMTSGGGGAIGTGGAATIPLAPAGAIVSMVAPLNPSPGTLWWDVETGQLYVWFISASGGQWVSASNDPEAV